MVRIIAAVCGMALFAALALEAEEISLAYKQAPDRPVRHEHFEIFEEDAEAWTKGGELLSDRAVTLFAYFPIEGMDDGLVCAYDYSSKEAARPDVFYADIDFDLCLDEGEKFPLAPTRMLASDFPPGTDPPLCAEKISLAAIAREGSGPFLVNVHLIAAPPDEDYAFVYMWCEAWGCYQGRISAKGRDYDLFLRDENVNGSFADLEGSGEECDTITLVPSTGLPAGEEPLAQKLRGEMLLGGAAQSVAVKDSGRALSTMPVAVDFGETTAPAADIEVTLASDRWGLSIVRAGAATPLPVGTWAVSDFRQMGKEPGAFCKFLGPEAIKIVVKNGKKTAIPKLETSLTPTVTTRGKGKKKRTLSLVMTTAQGATFKDYKNPALADSVPGVPVKITDRSGRTVADGHFTFQ